MKKTYYFAPGVLVRCPRRRRVWPRIDALLQCDMLLLSCLLTAGAAAVGLIIGGAL